ncbi:GNAT family N-acetyltransferase [Streptosporangium soli]|nr:GNAT family N-acetyltransferase [Streptosporangium sp. KLBMP 9127]
MDIRAPDVTELPRLQEIERAAGRCFRDVGMPEIADDEPLTLAELARYQGEGMAWVAVEAGQVLAYLIADEVDGNGHVEQVSVHPDHAGQGTGRALIDHLAAQGFPALTLTAFTEVPWNGPYYERCGFRPLQDSELTPGLRVIRRREAEHGLDRWPRACMRRDL